MPCSIPSTPLTASFLDQAARRALDTRACCIYVIVDTWGGAALRWTWDPEKDAVNRRKHRLPLSIGEVALADPLALSRHDPHPDGDRWDTLCQAGAVLLFIVHTWPDDDATPGRIISARKATRQERKAYEDGKY
jgi:uncharacterized protein